MRVSTAVLAFVLLSGCAPQQLGIADLRSAAAAGDRNAQYTLGRMYYNGRGVQKDYATAAKWFREAANNGHIRAASSLASMYSDGKGVPQDYAEALRLLEPGTAEGDIMCLNCLAWLLATCPDDRFRDGNRALGLAQRLVAVDPKPAHIDTLAAAYAATGRFEDAIRTQNQAIATLEKTDFDMTKMVEYRNHLASYEEHKPWRDPQH